MKYHFAILTALGLLGLFCACSMQTVSSSPAKNGRVILSATGAQKPGTVARVSKPAKSAATKRLGAATRSSHVIRSLARDIGVGSITTMTYAVTDMGPSGSGPAGGGTIDPNNPFVDLYLTPNENYRIVVSLGINATAPGYFAGVTAYGDQADFLVDPAYDTYVDLTVHPNQAVVFDPASVVSGSSSTVQMHNPTATPSLFASALTVQPADRFFYGADARLYYFNKFSNSVYHWTNINSPMSGTDAVITGAIVAGLTGRSAPAISAACADPTTADTIWLVGSENSGANWWYYQITNASSTPALADSYEFTSDITSSGLLPNVVVTGVAVDSTYSDVYVTYYSSDGSSTVHTGVLQYYGDSLEYYSIQNTVTTSDPTASIFTDVVWDQGKAWVLLSPYTSWASASITHNTGTAEVQTYDDFLNPIQTYPASAPYSHTGPSALAILTTGATQLILPNRIAGPVQGSTLWISQADFAATTISSEKTSSMNLDNGAVTTY